jgi:aerobic carbon-monoxide dehydrogenase medium subunit
MTTVPAFDYEIASTLEAALAAVAEGATPMHGGTELLPAMGLGLLRPQRVVSLRKLEELRVCRRDGDVLVLGAGLNHNDIGTSPLVAAGAPLLAEVASEVGNIRVRCTGTLGGNLAFAEPRSDVTTALLALDAEVRLASANGQRRLPLAEFLVGAYETQLQPGELITVVAVPFDRAKVAVYRKVVFSERPVVGVALTFVDGRGWRLVVGAVGMSPVSVDTQSLDDVDLAAITAAIDVTADLAGSEDYKVHLTAVTIDRCLRGAAEQWERAR